MTKAGERCRNWWAGAAAPAYDRLDEDIAVISAFRMAHAYPLQMVASSLRHHVAKRCRKGDVAQRLKRLPTIFDKLERQPKMELARMQDVGGCGAVVPTEADIRTLLPHLRKSRAWRIVGEPKDYIATPKSDGYRAYHLVVAKEERQIEIQLRTIPQHQWAELVETFDRQHNLGLKTGRASTEDQEYFRLGADMIAAAEGGERPDALLVDRFQELHRSFGARLAPKEG